ncbi:MAG: hypothetical protein FH756_02445 [Firmicutes bacterium]|nr:hypothetical protein [Bacillota bacterium]
MDQVVSLVIPFIALAIISVMIDKFTLFLEGVMEKVPGLPDYFEWPVAYIIVLTVSLLFCWQGRFDLFSYLDINFLYDWEGWLMTALVISGGSAFVRTSFNVVDSIPMGIGSVSSAVTRILPFSNKKSQKGSDYDARV